MTTRIAPADFSANSYRAADYAPGIITPLPARLIPMPVAAPSGNHFPGPDWIAATAGKPDYRMVMALDLSKPIDTLTIDSVRQFARLLRASLNIACIDDRADASERQAVWHIRDLLRYQSAHHTFSFLTGSDAATAFNDYLTQQRDDLLILSSQLHHRFFPITADFITRKTTRFVSLPVLAVV